MSRPLPPVRALLGVKLGPPAAAPSQLPRPRIAEAVWNARTASLVLLRAPAGFGKTTALLQCRALLEERGVATGWLTLDSADNDASRFLAGLRAAIAQMLGRDDEPDSAGSDDAASGSVGDMAIGLISTLAAQRTPFALFLDDFEALRQTGVLELTREIVSTLPPNGRLVIGSRTNPDLGLGRLRARGQLLELDAEQLRFSIEETREYLLARRHLVLSPDDVGLLQRKTEGWIAGLWLASISLERQASKTEFIARFSGSDRSVAEYLVEDVLAAQPEVLRDFLMRTSILKNLDADICDALVPGVNSSEILARLAADNVLLSPIEGDPGSYRYHSLFAGFLRSRLQAHSPHEVPRLHRAAARWYESRQRAVPALDHAIAGADFDHALRLLDSHAMSLLAQGRMRLLSRWFAQIPPEVLRQRPLLQAVQAWALCFTRGPWVAMALVEDSGLEASADPEVVPHVLALRPMLLAMMDDFEQADVVGRESLALLPTSSGFADSVLSIAMANVFAVMGRYREAEPLLGAARLAQGSEPGVFNLMYSESVEGLIDLQEGRIRQAAARFRRAVDATHAANPSHTSGNAWAGILYAGAVYDRNELPLASHLLHVYLPLARDVGLPDHMMLGYMMLSRIASSGGDVDHAFELLDELEYLGHQRQLPRVVATARLERARLLLSRGRAEPARQELERADDARLWQRIAALRLPGNDLDYLRLGKLRWQVLAGDPRQAAAALRDEIAESQRSARHRRALKLRLLLAIAEHRGGDRQAAFDGLHEALQATHGEGAVRLVLDEGPAMGELLRDYEASRRKNPERVRDAAFAEYVAQLLRVSGSESLTEVGTATAEGAGTALPAGKAAGATLPEPLTRGELRALELLAEGYSNSAMAEKLFVSESTVRTHLRNINAKLNAKSRTQAVAIARQLGVLH